MFDITYNSILQEQRFWITFEHARNDETQPTVIDCCEVILQSNLVVKSLIFHLGPLFFALHGATELFILVVCF